MAGRCRKSLRLNGEIVTDTETRTEFLFSYGTLQLEAVQMANFGRLLTGQRDVLEGFRGRVGRN